MARWIAVVASTVPVGSAKNEGGVVRRTTTGGDTSCTPPPWPHAGWGGLGRGYDASVFGQVSMVDSIIDVRGLSPLTAPAITSTSNTLYMRGVYLRGFKTLAHFARSGHSLPAPSASDSVWAKVDEFAHGEEPPPQLYNNRSLQKHAPVVIDGVR
jgi:hypothetical protein